ncbi:MAG: hypothetical protein AB7V50_10990 [Vampirovibrionia bacterium]
MINRKNIGSALVDYMVPTAVIGLVLGMGLYYLVSEDKILNFSAASAKMDIKAGDQMAIVGNKVSTNDMWDNFSAGSFDGTEENPVSNCQSGTCIIDYGDFILNGIPEDFNEYVQANGTSGGTDKLVSILNQMADQLEQKGKTSEADELRDLANLGAFIADTQENAENDANTCKNTTSTSDERAMCLESAMLDLNGIPLPDNISDILTTFNTGGSGHDLSLISSSVVGDAKYTQVTNPTTFDIFKTEFPAYAMVDVFESIKNNPNIPSSMKDVAEEVYRGIDTLSLDFRLGVENSITYPSSEFTEQDYDPVTGTQVGSVTGGTNLYNPTTSLTDLISKLVD